MKEKAKAIFSKLKKISISNPRKRNNIFQKVKKINFGNIFFGLFLATILFFSLKGVVGNLTPMQMNQPEWKNTRPLELSPDRARYALIYALVDEKSFSFSPPVAAFAAPDVAYTDGRYVSLFAPSLSVVASSGYIIGKYFNLAQVGSFAVVAIFALLNVFLIRAIAIRLGAHPLAGSIAGLTFLVASPAFAYAVTLYQHHLSTFLLLLSFYLLLRYKSVWSLFAIWMLYGFSFSVDYPNFFLLMPVAVAAFVKIVALKKMRQVTEIKFSFARLLAMTGIIIPFLFLFWFNVNTYGNPTQLAGTLERAIEVRKDGSPLLESKVLIDRMKQRKEKIELEEKSFLGFFQTRQLIRGFYEHFVSLDRGMIVYTPVILLGFVGLIFAYRKKTPYLGLLVAVIGFDILLYSLWDDPFGGWAFGSRYLIPAYAFLAIFISILLTRMQRYSFFLLFFFAVAVYSIGVNTAGAITSIANPPRVEAEALGLKYHMKPEYTFMRNIGLLQTGSSQSFIYQTVGHNYVTAWDYYRSLVGFIIIGLACMLIYFRIGPGVKEEFLTYVDTKTKVRRKRSPLKTSLTRPTAIILGEERRMQSYAI